MTNEELRILKRALAALNSVGFLAQNDVRQFPADAADERTLNILKESVEKYVAQLKDVQADINAILEKASK